MNHHYKDMSPEAILAYIASDNSKLFKEATIAAVAAAGNKDFFTGIRLALDNFDTFGVKKVPVRNGHPAGPGISMELFKGLCDQLIKRELTGDDAKTQIELMMRQSTDDQWNGWYRPILMKKLDAGFSETTVNKAVKKFPDLIIPVFGCQLAHDSKDHEGKLVGKKMIDLKFDGARCLTFVYPDGHVIQTSRNGKELENFPKIASQFSAIARHLPEPHVFDGEMMSSSFQDLMKQFKRKTDVDTDDAVYFVFDALPLSEFRAGKSKLRQKERSEGLAQYIEHFKPSIPNVESVGFEEVNLSTPEGKQRFREINEKAIEGGYEGIMIKEPNGYYETKRSHAWLKKKPTIELTMTITGYEQGKPDSKYRDVLGAFLCECVDNGRIIKVSCGGGFSDEERERFWRIRDEMIGVLMEVEADAITQNQNGEYSLRFPRKKTFRGFVPGEQI
jgi:DNA ligase-1